MGVLISRSNDPDLYRDAYEEAQRIIRTSEEVRISLEKVAKDSEPEPTELSGSVKDNDNENSRDGKLSTSKLAAKLGMRTADLLAKLVSDGYLETRNGSQYLTEKGKAAGGEFRKSQKYGVYFLWPDALNP